MRILVVEDDEFTTRSLIAATAHKHYVVELATDHRTTWDQIEAFPFDLMVLDTGVPGLDAMELCRQVRSQGYQFPILLLTNQSNGHQKALGLDAGADDSVVKPFDPEELEARIRALLRRGAVMGQPILKWGELQVDPSTCEVRYGEKVLSLTPKEYALLELFMRHHHRVFSYALILEQVWSYEEIPGEDAVRTHIKGLRQKLKSVGAPGDLIETVYGIGYRLKPSEGNGEGEERQRPEGKGHKGPSFSRGLQPHRGNDGAEIGELTTSHNGRNGQRSPGEELRQQTLTAIAEVWERFQQREDSATGPGIMPTAVMQSVAAHAVPEAKLLIVDNDPKILAMAYTLLEPWGLHVTTLANSGHFWQVLQETQPDLLILDLHMPSPNGYELCHALRESDRWSYLPIIILTAYTNSNAVNQLFAVGADDFITKPFVGPELITRVINRLERVRLLRRLNEKCPVAKIDPKMVCPFQPDRFFTLSHDLLCTITLDGQFQRLNPAFEQTLGYQSDQLLGQPFLEFVHPDDRDQTHTAFSHAVQGVPLIDFTNRYRCQNGSYAALSWHAIPAVEEGMIYAIAHAI